ncbi:MAG: phosphoglycerate kinase [Candidatus Aenigmatarchaeota archaeon]
MKSMENVDVEGKKVLLRVDLNSTVKQGRVKLTPRMKAHAKTIEELCERSAAVVVLAHQGRPGRDDFLHLEQHAEHLNHLLDRRVIFIEDIAGELAEKAVGELQEEDVLLLDNVRMHDDELAERSPEEHAVSELVQKLSSWCDLYVNDAFSVCHRNHASITGFPQVMESAAGPVLEKDMEAIRNLEETRRPRQFVLGGNKPKDAVNVLHKVFEEDIADLAMLGGAPGEIFLQVQDKDLGPKERDVSELEGKIQELLGGYGNKILLPEDLAYEKNRMREEVDVKSLPVREEVFDIGTETIEKFNSRLSDAETVVMNGPVGKFEDDNFSKGTEKIFERLKKLDKYVLIGGGDTSEAIEQLGFDIDEDYSHVSLAGGAFVKALLGEELVGMKALR